MDVSTWKWEHINMDFSLGLPKTRRQYDSILAITDRVTKSAHFIPVKPTYLVMEYARLYLNEIVSLHGFFSHYLG